MVPTIYPLETLHNALSLHQVSEFLSRVCQRHTDAQAHASAALFDSMHSNQASDSPFCPPRTLHSPTLQLRQRCEKPPWYSSGPSSTVSSAGPSSPTAVDGNCQFGFSDQPSLSSHVTEEHQVLGLFQESPGDGAQELLIEEEQEPFEQNQSPQEPPVETNQSCQEVAEEVSQPCQDAPAISQPCQDIPVEVSQACQEAPAISQPCQEVAEEVRQPCQEAPAISQPCQDIPEEVSQACQEAPAISQPCQENNDIVNQICQEVPQISHPCQNATQLCWKVSEEACQLCQENPEEVSQLCPGVPVEVGRLAHQVPVGISLVQEILVDVGEPAQEILEELSQPCQEFSVEVGRLAQGASAISLLPQDNPEVDKPSQEFPGEDDLQVQEVPEVNQQSWILPEVTDQLPGDDIPQVQYPSSDPNPQSQALARDQHSALTCD